MSTRRQIKFLGLSFIPALAILAMPGACSAKELDWALSEDGSRVIDPLRKLVWLRCVEGLQWNGRMCKGDVAMLSHGEAVALANERNKSEGGRCRLPTVAELQLQVKNMAVAESKSYMLFPSVSPSWRWAGNRIVNTASVNQYNYGNIMNGRTNDNAVRVDVLHAWAVDQSTGEARKDVTKRTRLPVQLVCPVL